MKFHVPPNIAWSSDLLVKALESDSLQCSSADCSVVVQLPPIERKDFPMVWRKIVTTPQISVRYIPNKAFYNGVLEYDVRMFMLDAQVERVCVALEEIGCTILRSGDLEIELEQLLKTVVDREIIAAQFDEIARFEQVKREFVATQDFDKAFEVLNEQDRIRDRIDQVVAECIQRSRNR